MKDERMYTYISAMTRLEFAYVMRKIFAIECVLTLCMHRFRVVII